MVSRWCGGASRSSCSPEDVRSSAAPRLRKPLRTSTSRCRSHRSAESVFRGSLFRTGYEIFYTPIPADEKRAAKSIIDVGFDRLGDAIGGEPHRATVGGQPVGHWTIPVTLSGPRTIPFLEYHGARGTPETEVLDLLQQHLDEHERVVLYGHPCYEGVRDRLLRRVFAAVVERGFRFVTMQTMAEQLRAVAAAQ